MHGESLEEALLSGLVVTLLLWSTSFMSQSTTALRLPQSGIFSEAALQGGTGPVQRSYTLGSLAGQTTCPTCGGTGKITCPNCNGTGGERVCSLCGGTGLVECLTCHGTGRCFACNGTGKCQACESWYAVYDTPCPACGGTGMCSVCNGTGLCYACNGTGHKTCWKCGGTGREGICPLCGGTGEVECPTCGGTGLVTEEEEKHPTPELGACVTQIQGNVKITRNGREVTARPLTLRAEDEILTGDDGQIEIAFLDGTMIRISSNCHFVFGEFIQEITKPESFWDRIWGLIKGRIWSVIRGKSCQIQTRTAITGVRGTELTLEVAEDGTTTLMVLEGTVEFSDLNLMQTTFVTQYQTSFVPLGGTPSSPRSIDPKEIDRWWEWKAVAEIPPSLPLIMASIAVAAISLQPKKMRRAYQTSMPGIDPPALHQDRSGSAGSLQALGQWGLRHHLESNPRQSTRHPNTVLTPPKCDSSRAEASLRKGCPPT